MIDTAPVRLCQAALDRLPEPVKRPRYDRSALRPGIVHIGVGNFHRAHQSWYLHRLMQRGLAQDWAIIGAGVRPPDAAMRERLLAQDCLTTLIELGPDGVSAEVVGPMIDYVPVAEGNAPLIAALADPAIRIVTLTVTEGGYFIDPATGRFDAAHPDIRRDASAPGTPGTAFGAIVAGLRRRRADGAGALSVLSCDNLHGNGEATRRAVVSLARLSDPDLAAWVEETCAFPNSMVDSIVPATGPEEIALARSLGVDDAVPVTHENFRQWVIEEAFCAGRPDWDRAGATFSNDVAAYETMKLRVLNAGHQILANAGEVLGLATIADCMNAPPIAGFFSKVQTEEILPLVRGPAGMRPRTYFDLVAARFANPAIRDTTRRVAFDGSSRHSGFVLPILRDAADAGAPMAGLALSEALWARMCYGVREDGSTIEPNDPHWDGLLTVARRARERPAAWIEQEHIYGDLARNAMFSGLFEQALADLWQRGVEPVLADYGRIDLR